MAQLLSKSKLSTLSGLPFATLERALDEIGIKPAMMLDERAYFGSDALDAVQAWAAKATPRRHRNTTPAEAEFAATIKIPNTKRGKK